MLSEPAAAPVPRDAATVIVARDGDAGLEVFLVRRSSRSAWLPDFYVFPGGAVDPDDRSPAAAERVEHAQAAIETALVVAAARETFEEAGLLFSATPLDAATLAAARAALHDGERSWTATLDALGARIDGRALVPFSRWITPAVEPRRFDARFFVARAPRAQIAEADARETHDGRWISPRGALDARERGEIGLIFPTVKHLERIARFAEVDALLAFAATKPIVPVMPDHQGEPPNFAIPPELEDAW